MTAGCDSSSCPAALRDECELRYVLSLGTKAERAEYLDRAERYDGKASTDVLRQHVIECWHAARSGTPVPCKCVGAPAPAPPVHLAVNEPGNGSSLSTPNAGNSNPVGGVISGGGA